MKSTRIRSSSHITTPNKCFLLLFLFFLSAIVGSFSTDLSSTFALSSNSSSSNLPFNFSTFLGGSNLDSGTGIAVDSLGNCYVTGYTWSSNFPTKNAYNSTFGGVTDVFIAKYDSRGNLVFSTFFGGSGSDISSGIVVDAQGNSYITGSTYSPNFPTKNAYNSTF